jgi:transposase
MHSDASGDDPKAQAVPLTMPASVPECHAVIQSMALEIGQLREQMGWLQERLKVDSRNSSKPPSSDGPGGGNRAQRRASARKRGAQKGHPGAYRALLPEAQVDAVHDCAPVEVCDCGGSVSVQGKPVRHQVFDVPPVVAEVNEYRLYSGRCAQCGRGHLAVLPPGVPSGQIGPRALALIGVLGTRFHLTQGKIRDLLAQTLGLDFSVGAISQAHGKVAEALTAPLVEACASLGAAPLLHLDETRYPREGSANWVWAAVQPRLAVFSILPSRARYVAQDLIGVAPSAVVVSDRYAAYGYIDASRRQVCWAECGHQAS